MAYTDVAEMAGDDDLRQRLYACVAQLGLDNGAMFVDRWVWQVVAQDPAWAGAWAAAALAGVTRRGWDASVITDDMIWDRVRAVQDTKGNI